MKIAVSSVRGVMHKHGVDKKTVLALTMNLPDEVCIETFNGRVYQYCVLNDKPTLVGLLSGEETAQGWLMALDEVFLPLFQITTEHYTHRNK